MLISCSLYIFFFGYNQWQRNVTRINFLLLFYKLCLRYYCRSGNIQENLIFANMREFVASRIQSSR